MQLDIFQLVIFEQLRQLAVGGFLLVSLKMGTVGGFVSSAICFAKWCYTVLILARWTYNHTKI